MVPVTSKSWTPPCIQTELIALSFTFTGNTNPHLFLLTLAGLLCDPLRRACFILWDVLLLDNGASGHPFYNLAHIINLDEWLAFHLATSILFSKLLMNVGCPFVEQGSRYETSLVALKAKLADFWQKKKHHFCKAHKPFLLHSCNV